MRACGACLSDLAEEKQKRQDIFDILSLFFMQILLVTCVEWMDCDMDKIFRLGWVGVEFGLGWRCWHD
jgi:hypothetical protein